MNKCCVPAEIPITSSLLEDIGLVKSVLSKSGNMELVELLEKTGPCINKYPPGFSNADLTRRLQELNAAGIVQGVFTGQNLCFCVNDKTMAKVRGQQSNPT